jgi:hypothetical protein
MWINDVLRQDSSGKIANDMRYSLVSVMFCSIYWYDAYLMIKEKSFKSAPFFNFSNSDEACKTTETFRKYFVTWRLKARIVEPEQKPITSQVLVKHEFLQQWTDAKVHCWATVRQACSRDNGETQGKDNKRGAVRHGDIFGSSRSYERVILVHSRVIREPSFVRELSVIDCNCNWSANKSNPEPVLFITEPWTHDSLYSCN